MYLLDVPALYETLAASIDEPPTHFLDDSELKEVEDQLPTALTTRVEQGWKAPLQDVPMAELLHLFSKAAFLVYREEYLENNITSSKAILCNPLCPEEVANCEERLGPLSPDVKEMGLIADGFYGGWHFAGGGWRGIHAPWKEPATKYEIYLGYEPNPVRTVQTRTRLDGSMYEVVVHVITHGGGQKARTDWGDIYIGNGLTECDNFLRIFCPSLVWKKMQEDGGKMVKEGEYAFLYYANWTASGDIHHSVRDWIAKINMELERNVAVGCRQEPPK
jgi:hypothetical protein